MVRFSLPIVVVCTWLAGCGGETSEGPAELGRPVTVFRVEESTPDPSRLFPGVVTPYRQTEVPFQVPGRIVRLIDIGDDVEGEQEDLDNVVVQQGTILAQLDPAPFERALRQVEQRLSSSRLELKAQEVQLDQVLPARLDSAKSQAEAARLNANYAKDDVEAMVSAVELATTTVERNRELLPTGAVSDIAVRQSETELQAQKSRLAQARTLVTTREREHDAAVATIAEIEGAVALQAASNEALTAGILELEQAVLDAESNLEDSVLRAPFPGRVTQLHVGEGSFVQAGGPVVTLTMMNPIEVVVSVSAAVEEQLLVGTDSVIYASNGDEIDFDRGVRATLYQKRGVANSSTRTFEVGLIAPNRRRVERDIGAALPRAQYVIPIFDNPLDRPGEDGIYTVAEAVGRTGGETWVMRVEGLSQGARTAETLEGILRAERVPVRLGERKIQVASFTLVELDGAEGLQAGDLLVPDPTPEHASGFVVDDNRWLLRPGDVVQVALESERLPSGLYVPVQAIRELDGQTHVFIVGADDVVKAAPVEVHDSTGELRRVVSEGLTAGDTLVMKGAHFLQDGDRVLRTGAGQ